jgi:hypothetical protein
MTWGLYLTVGVVVLGVIFLFMFRTDIRELIRSIRKIDKSGVTLASMQKDPPTERDPKAEAEALLREFDSALLRELEDSISEDLRRRNLTGAEAIPVLVRHLASAYIGWTFEITYRTIWGTQLSLLEYLNANPGQPVDAVRPFYEIGASVYSGRYQGYPIQQWLGFLKDSLLLREDGGVLNITVRGREFLLYLTRYGYPTGKDG